MIVEPSRRRLITGLISFVAAPAIVRANSLMPVKVINESPWWESAGPNRGLINDYPTLEDLKREVQVLAHWVEYKRIYQIPNLGSLEVL